MEKSSGYILLNLHLLVLIGCIATISTAEDYNTTLSALLAFKEAITYDPTGFFNSWNPSFSPNYCTWPGLLCVLDNLHVTSLHLDSLQLNGTISPRISDLMPHLVSFNISNNLFHGSIPEQIASPNSTSLQELDLSSNRLSGTIPNSIHQHFADLRYLALNNNQLSIKVSDLLTNASFVKLEYLALSKNNAIASDLPLQIGLLSNLRLLLLHQCSIIDFIPAEIANCSSLQSIDLSYNSLAGPIPSVFGSLPSLTELNLTLNSLTGSIPSSIVNSTQLKRIWLAFNNISGIIPYDIGKLQSLQSLRVSFNPFLTGSIPESIGQCSQLTSLAVEYTSGNGPLPDSLYNLTKLQILRITSSGLTGSLSEDVRNLKHLQILRLSYNYLQGRIPTGLGELKNLQGLDLEGNKFEGSIPSELSGCASLSLMDLSYNSLTGSIPESFAQLQEITILSLQCNMLSGEIPDIFDKLSALTVVNLSYNTFSGQIPESLALLASLSISLDLSVNNLTGAIPPSLGGMHKLTLMNLSNNQFTSQIPATLKYCQGLQVLDLSMNSLQGEIPYGFNEMISLEFLDLSHNQLTGSLPSDLGNLTYLQFLNVSYNDLQGSIPSGGIYNRLNWSSFIGNPRLCGSLLHRECKSDSKLASESTFRKAAMIICAFIVVAIALLAALCYRRGKKFASKNENLLDMGDLGGNGMLKFKLWKLKEVKAMTNNFDTRQIIGTGSVSVCYKGFIHNSGMNPKIVVVKRLSIWDDHGTEARKSFVSEVKTICKMKHRNLVKMLGYCLEGEELALMMEFMNEGDLHEHLYGSCSKLLTWEERLSIAMDVAEALVYMHHEYDHTIVHCDLKPKNILLNSDKTAKISDFGVARLLSYADRSGMDNTSASMFRGTLGYSAPEYAHELRVSTKVDVYSYGVLLIELLSGVSPTSPKLQGMGISLQVWAAHLQRSGKILEVLDIPIQQVAHQSHVVLAQANLILVIAIECCNIYAKRRPTMKFIRDYLSTIK